MKVNVSVCFDKPRVYLYFGRIKLNKAFVISPVLTHRLRFITPLARYLLLYYQRALRRWIKEKQKEGVQVVLDAAPEDESEEIPLTASFPAPVTFQPEHGVLDNELAKIYRRFERTLRPKELAVFQLRHNSGMTFEGIGQELRIKPGTAKVRYHRALVAFKTWLKKHYSDIYYFLNGGGE